MQVFKGLHLSTLVTKQLWTFQNLKCEYADNFPTNSKGKILLSAKVCRLYNSFTVHDKVWIFLPTIFLKKNDSSLSFNCFNWDQNSNERYK